MSWRRDISQWCRNNRGVIALSLILTGCILAVYWQAVRFEYVSFDDTLYITENHRVKSGLTVENLTWAFTSLHAGNWHPLTWVSHMADVSMFGLDPGMHHLTSVMFHCANSILLLFVLGFMTKAWMRSAFVAFLFALHPLHVESVAWVSERKDVLSAFFWLLTMLGYIWYVHRGSVQAYLVTLFFFAFGLMSKPMIITLPFVLLLMDLWPLGRMRIAGFQPPDEGALPVQSVSHGKDRTIRFLIMEKVPFLALAMISGLITFYAQKQGGAVSSVELLPLDARLFNAALSYGKYALKVFMPYDLAVFYPYPEHFPLWHVTATLVCLTAISLLGLFLVRSRPYVLMGWSWYLGTLVPVIGIVQVGSQAMADRYMYIPAIGLFVVISWGGYEVFSRWKYGRNALVGASVLIVLAVMSLSAVQAGHWKNTVTLFSHALEATSRNHLAHNNLGYALLEEEKIDEALAHLQEAIRIKPNYARAHVGVGIGFYEKGHHDEAIKYYTRSLELRRDFDDAHYNLGLALFEKGEVDRAVAHYQETVRISPEYSDAYNNIGHILAQKGEHDQAVSYYEKALRTNPFSVRAYTNISVSLFRLKRFDEARAYLEQALTVEPSNASLLYALGEIHREKGDVDAAIHCYTKVLTLAPGHSQALRQLAHVCVLRNDLERGVGYLKEMLLYQPDNPDIYYNIACVYSRQLEVDKSVEWLRKAIEKGFDRWDLMLRDEDLENIRETASYQELVKENAIHETGG